MSISLYDVLDVAPDASSDEIRAAWRSAVADLDPTDRRFAVYNEAGSVLLDPGRRAAYDAERAAEAEVPTGAAAGPGPAGPGVGPAGDAGSTGPAPGPARRTDDAGPDAGPAAASATSADSSAGLSRAERRIGKQARKKALKDARVASAGQVGDGLSATRQAGEDPSGGGAGRSLRRVPNWALAALGVVLAVLVALSVHRVVTVPPDDAVASSSRDAQSAAERAIGPLLSYDYRTLEEDSEAAKDWMTEDYFSEKYEPLFAQIQETAPQTKTVVRTEVVASALVRSGEERVQVLLFVDRPTRNKSLEEPVVYKDQARLTMQKVGDRWLVDQLCTTASCES